MQVTKLSPGQFAVVEVSATSRKGGATAANLTLEVSDHKAAYAVATDPTHVTVVSRGPLGPFELILFGTDAGGFQIPRVIVPFEVVAVTEFKVAVGVAADVNKTVPGIPAGW